VRLLPKKSLAVGAIMMAMRHDPGMARPGGTGALRIAQFS